MVFRTAICAAGLLAFSGNCSPQSTFDPTQLRNTPAVSGHEQALSRALFESLKDYEPKTDNLGNVYVTFGSGAPRRLIATAIDEPGYIVSEVTEDGYLRVQRLPQAAPHPLFDALHFAQPVVVVTRGGKQVAGVFAGLSVHLQPGRLNPPRMNHVEELYVDIGAKNADEVRAAGVDLLDPIAPAQRDIMLAAAERSGPGAVERAGTEILLRLLQHTKESKVPGTTTIAFVTQQWLGGRGLTRLLTEIQADEGVLVNRTTFVASGGKDTKLDEAKPGDGILLGIPVDSQQRSQEFAARLRNLAAKEQIPARTMAAAPRRIAGYAKGAMLPAAFIELGLPVLWPVTPGETVSYSDAGRLQRLLEAYLGIPKPMGGLGGGRGGGGGHQFVIQTLTQTYGTSGHEEAVRETVLANLPGWARKKTTTDSAGNLVLRIGDGKGDDKTPRIALVAHMDEIGYEVKRIEDDGRLWVEVVGGGYPQFFLGHVVLIHVKAGRPIGGVLELPAGWDKPGFDWPGGSRSVDEGAYVYVGTRTKEETEKLGIVEGDFVTIPKQYRPLLGTRANARSFDDRVGCAALLAAVNAIGPDLPGRDVTFVWSTEEEIGLKGAAAFAEEAAKNGRTPDFVFAIDTFVSSDSPLETKRFADAELGKGFVVRAVDNSNIVPLQYADRVVALAKENNIAAQYGVTGGGNDGSVFTRFGSVDVALGWPLRYAHSPAEVIDLKDLDALGKIAEAIAKKW